MITVSSFNKKIYELNIIISNTSNYTSNSGILINYDYYIINVNDAPIVYQGDAIYHISTQISDV